MKYIWILFVSLATIHAQENSFWPQSKKVYLHSEDGRAYRIDPVESATTYSNRIVTAVYDTLFEYKYLQRNPYEVKPCLAASMPEVSADGLVYTIKIKQGVHFIDSPIFITKDNPQGKGREVVAADFVYSLKRHFDPRNSSQGSWLWNGRIVGMDKWQRKNRMQPKTDYDKQVEGLHVVDKYTIRLQLVKPYPQIIYTFTTGFSAVVPRELVESQHYDIKTTAVGSGPFRLASLTRYEAILQKNTTYRKEIFDIHAEGYREKIHGFTGIKTLHGKTLPIVDEVRISFIPSVYQNWNALMTDEIHISPIPAEQLDKALSSKNPPQLRSSYAKKFHFNHSLESGFVFSVFNMDDPNFGYNDDPKRNEMNRALRKAIRKAFDWRERIDTFYYGVGEPFVGVIPPNIAGYTEFSKKYVTKDIAGAKKLLKEAGWNARNLPFFEYPTTASFTSRQFFEQVRNWLVAIGYPHSKVVIKEYATFSDLNRGMKTRRHVINSYGWGLDYPDAENVMQLFYGKNASPGSNAANFDNEEYNRLFEKTAVMANGPQRTALYKRMTQILLDECVGMFGFSRTRLYLWNKKVIAYPTREILNNYFKYVDVK